MPEEKQMAGDYEIIVAFHIGDKEVVIGENLNAEPDEMYMCAFCTSNELFAQYNDVMVSDDYHEITKLFGQRIVDQSEKVRQEMFKPQFQGIDNRPITACDPITWESDLEDKIVVIKPDILRREYRVATHQLKLCTGGFGAHPKSRGSACFCVDLYTGKSSRFERQDILGTLEKDQLPQWAQYGLDMYLNKKRTERNER